LRSIRRRYDQPPTEGWLDPAGQAALEPGGGAATTQRSRVPVDPVRPEEDAGFLPRRDGSARRGCYGAAEAWQLASGREWGDVLELQGLTRRYGDVVALDGLSFTVREGQMFGFVGPNGAGKTTAMRIILGVLAPDAGEVRWRGRPMTDEIRKRLGYLPEDHGQTFSMTVRSWTQSRRRRWPIPRCVR
jgi:ABC-type glutathione transport system ATPase component